MTLFNRREEKKEDFIWLTDPCKQLKEEHPELAKADNDTIVELRSYSTGRFFLLSLWCHSINRHRFEIGDRVRVRIFCAKHNLDYSTVISYFKEYHKQKGFYNRL